MGADVDPPEWRPPDTSPEAWRRVVRAYAAMSVAERAQQMVAMSLAADRLARAGILSQEPEADANRIEYLLLERRYGTALAECVTKHRRLRD